MGRKLRNLVAAVGITLATLSPMKYANAQVDSLNTPLSLERAGNFFSPSGVNELVGKPWKYGDGDVNHDGRTDSFDLAVIDSVSNDEGDIDGDSLSSSANDKQILSDYLNGNIPYLPGDWANLNKEEKTSWIKKMIKIQNSLPNTDYSQWVCRNFITQMELEFYGSSNIDGFIQYYHDNGEPQGGEYYLGEKNARFGLPVVYAGTINTSGESHSVNGVLVGKDPLNFNDWYFFGYENDNQVVPGSQQMDSNSPVSIGLNGYFKGPFGPVFSPLSDLIQFELQGGEVVNIIHKNYVTLHNPEKIKVHLGKLEKIVIDNNSFPDVTNFTPEFLESQGYKAIPDTSSENPVKLTHEDSDTTNVSYRHFQFLRKFVGSVYSGGITKSDSSPQIIEVNNFTPVEPEDFYLPDEFKIYQNYPNPFNPTTNVKYETNRYGDVKLEVYNNLGQKVYEKTDKGVYPGVHEFKDIDMSKYASGMYLFRIYEGEKFKSIKGVLQK